jgi:hypothetical protein
VQHNETRRPRPFSSGADATQDPVPKPMRMVCFGTMVGPAGVEHNHTWRSLSIKMFRLANPRTVADTHLFFMQAGLAP